MPRITVHLTISGRVQGVSFRAVMRERATHHGVDGWVRNKANGSVEALLQGEEDAVMGLVEWSRVGPTHAQVTAVVQERRERHPRQTGFRIAD